VADTVVSIYLIEEHPRYLPLVEPLFHAVEDGRVAAAQRPARPVQCARARCMRANGAAKWGKTLGAIPEERAGPSERLILTSL
jgi:hypothetical protein